MNRTITLNPNRHSEISYQPLATNWNAKLQSYLNGMGLDVQVRTLELTGVRGVDVSVSMNTLGVEIEGVDVRKNSQRVLAYIEQYFKTHPLARSRAVGSSSVRKYTLSFNHPVVKKNFYPIVEVVVKF